MQRVEEILERVTELPFSPLAAKILELTRDEHVDARQIAKVIDRDQAFTARLLRIANSPYYGHSRAVTTSIQAVPVVGIDTILALALTIFNFGSFAPDKGAILSLRELWEHSFGCAFWSRQIARRTGHPAAEESFIAGLLHDMGKVIFYRLFNTEFLEAVAIAEKEGISLLAAEQSILGTDHAKAGAAVARKWNLSPVLLHTIECHHQPLSLPEDVEASTRKTVAIVHIADSLSDHFQIGCGVEIALATIDERVWDILRLDIESCNELLGAVLGEVKEFSYIFDLSSGANKPVVRAQPQSHGRRPATNGAQTVAALPDQRQSSPAAQPSPTMEDFDRIMEAGKQLALLAGLEDLYPNIATQAMMLLDADAAHVFLLQVDALEVAGAAGFAPLKGKRFPMEQSLVGWVAKVGEMMVLPNLEKAPASWEKDFFAAAGFRSHLFSPVDWAGKRLAVLCVHSRRERLWTAQEVALLNTFVGRVAVALDNARLYREAEDKAKALEGLNRKVAEALHVRTRFLATVSHELRSPLLVITGYANLLADQLLGPLTPRMADAVDKIVKQGNALFTMISHLLQITQMESGRLMLNHGPFDLKELLDEASRGMRTLIGAKPVAFETEYNQGFWPINTDRERLRQILGHLLDNAAKFTHEGKIVLRASGGEGAVEIVVEDTGIGIDPEREKIIFDGFRQVEEEDNRRYEGMGLGLYLSRRLLELLGGKIRVQSKAGEGSRFTIWLPCGELSPARASESP